MSAHSKKKKKEATKEIEEKNAKEIEEKEKKLIPYAKVKKLEGPIKQMEL